MTNDIHLHRSIPLLFGVPSASCSNRAIVASVIILVCSTFMYLTAEVWDSLPFFSFAATLLFIHAVIALTTTGANFLYVFRYMLVWILIFGTAYVWAIYPGEVFVAPFGLQFQTPANTRTLVLGGIFSLCGSLIGWHLSLKKFRRKTPKPFILPPRQKKRLKLAGYLLAFGFALLYVLKVGGVVGGDKSYANVEQGFALEFGVFNIFHFTGIALLLLASITSNAIQKKYIYIAIVTLIPGMMAGSRADFLPQAFLVFMLIFNNKIVAILISKKYWYFFAYFIGATVLLSFAYMVSTFIALWRGGGNNVLAVIEIILNSDRGLLINDIYGHKMLYFETGNMMLGGLYAAIVQVREGYTGLLFGESYFNYFLISPPAFLSLPRPLGLEWATEINGQIMAQGGIFEVAEAYWNFGLFGCFFVSFWLSYFFAWLLRRGLLHNNYFFIVWYFVFGIHGFRSIWYQTFSYFRLMTVMLVILGLSYIFFRWFSKDNDAYGTRLSARAD